MSGGAQVARLPDGRRLHLHHGPIDIVLEAFGPPDAVAEAERRAVARFAEILPELAAELPALRSDRALPVAGGVARRMAAATAASLILVFERSIRRAIASPTPSTSLIFFSTTAFSGNGSTP